MECNALEHSYQRRQGLVAINGSGFFRAPPLNGVHACRYAPRSARLSSACPFCATEGRWRRSGSRVLGGVRAHSSARVGVRREGAENALVVGSAIAHKLRPHRGSIASQSFVGHVSGLFLEASADVAQLAQMSSCLSQAARLLIGIRLCVRTSLGPRSQCNSVASWDCIALSSRAAGAIPYRTAFSLKSSRVWPPSGGNVFP